MMSNLSVRRGGEGELVRSLGADEIKRDDLAIHASPDSGGVTHSVRVHFFWAERVERYSVQRY